MSSLDDPRVLFAAERTLLAWIRTGITAIGLGFVVARFGLLMSVMTATAAAAPIGHPLASTLIGVALILVGAILCLLAVRQFRRLVASLKPSELPPGYSLLLTSGTGYAFAGLGIALAVYLALSSIG
jgi:putative membrane protein